MISLLSYALRHKFDVFQYWLQWRLYLIWNASRGTYRAPMRRRTSVLTQKEPHEAGKPFGEKLYKKSEDLTKGIYGVTVKDTETVKDEEKGKL